VAALVCIVPIGDWGAYSAQHSLRFLGEGKERVDKGRGGRGRKGKYTSGPLQLYNRDCAYGVNFYRHK